MASVTVLLTTYNSERFVREQIDSILRQRGVELRLVARDDGSTDSTHAILDGYKEQGSLSWYADGDNLGPARSFLRMIADAPAGSDFYALSDHDDVWMDDKLQAAVTALGAYDPAEPSLYFCQTQLVDEQLRPFAQQKVPASRDTFGESLMYFFVSGCTMVMNNAMRQLIASYTPAYVYMHDLWIYMVAKAVGANVVHDHTPHILYRQHSDNFVGLHNSAWDEMRLRYHRLLVDHEHVRQRMAEELLRGFRSVMVTEHVDVAEEVAHYQGSLWRRIRLLFDSRLHPGDRKTLLLSKLAILFGTL